ncbi:FHA domain-containing protein [Thalassoglobus sp. JC818]|uniref:FHA domain-containing protein n=1 Tax=Thalassoglobus sp. JC818 TaxID=3232136 RepID=UPI003458D34B
MRYLLKIFSGPHIGAEVELPTGESTIGSSDDCDLVLTDRLIAEQHVAVSVSDSSISIRQLGSEAVLVDGKPVDSAELRPFQYFTIGTTHLAIGPADKPWPHFDLSDFQLRPPVEEAEPSQELDDVQSESDATETSVTPAETQLSQSRGSRRFPVMITSVALFFALNAALVFAGFSNNWLDSKPETTSEQANDIEAERSNFERLVKEFSPGVEVDESNQRLELTGYVIRETDREQLLEAAKNIDPHVIFKVRSTESLLAVVNEILSQAELEQTWSASITNPGVIKISGTLETRSTDSEELLRKTLERIEKDVPLKELLVDVTKTRSILEESEVIAEVNLSEDSDTQTVPTPPTERLLRSNPIPIIDVRIANDRVFTLPNGIQISVGGRLSDGSRVEEIEFEHAIVRTKSGQRMIVPFGL